MLGRTFLPEEEQTGRDQVVILTNAYWRRRFNSDPNIVGTTLAVGGKLHTIIGVLPANVLRYSADFLKPLAFEYPADRKAGSLDVFARLAPGVTLAQAQAELDTIASQLQREYPATNKDRRFTLMPLDKYYAAIEGKASRGLLLMLGAVGLVMLIACANVANLLLARGVARHKECVVRAAIGANRARLVRQMLVESVLLFLLGGALGALLARWLVDSLLALAIAGNYVPERMIVAIDARVFVFTLLISLVAGVAFGLGPALQASRVDLNDGLRASSPTLSGRRHRASRLLIVSELALSLVLLVGFGLLIRSFVNVEAESASMDGESLLVTDAEGGRDFSQAVAYWQEALDRVRRVPGVQFAAVSSRPPVHDARSQSIFIEGHAPASDTATPMAGDILVSADYFRTMKIPILKGRAFTDDDTGAAPPVIIVSDSLAHRFFPDENPIGWHVSLKERMPMTCCSAPGPVENVWREIVGVAADIRQANLDDDLAETVYRPYTQIVEHDMFLTIRTLSGSDTTRVATQARSTLLTMKGNNDWPVRSMQQIIDDSQSIRLRRFLLILFGTFAALAVALAAVGTYGIMTYSVAERTREIGIRMALGATRPAVLRQVLSETTRLTLAGLMLGALAAFALTRFISAMLFGISATDGVTYLGVSVVLAFVALLASYLPARRATGVDPIAALRHE
jgi:putative ABC transport system permease protein